MAEQSSFTFREGVLSSLLVHACLVIYVLLFPGVFNSSGRLLRAPRDPNAPIPLEFIEEKEQSPSVAMGDAGRKVQSDPDARRDRRPENDQPFSKGNTPNRFVAPPVPEKAPPSPAPGPGGSAGQAAALPPGAGAPDEGREGRNGTRDDARATSQTPADSSRTAFYDSPSGEPGAQGSGRSRGSLKNALDRMSLGMSGSGAPLRYDNPVGSVTGPMGGLSFDTPDFDWGPYARKIYWIIWTNWTQGWPPAAWAGMKGVVTVHFRISRDGTIGDITIEDASGTPAFDTCATVALEASSPLPPLPSDFPKESEGITARFLYNMDASER